jgi:hypothetical protein
MRNEKSEMREEGGGKMKGKERVKSSCNIKQT